MSGAPDPGECIEIDGLRVRCLGPEAAPAVLFSAGLGGSGGYWAPQLAAFARDYRVITYDHRGTGESARRPLPQPYSVAALADDIRIVLDGLGLARAHLVGHAAGGLACLDLARRQPARVATLTVVNGWASVDPHFARCMEIRRAIHRTSGAEAYLKAQPLFLYPASWISDHLEELDAERARSAASFQDEATLFARMNALLAFDARSELGAIRQPTLIVAADDDMLVPARASLTLADGLPNATLARLPWGGHAVNVTAPDAFNEQLRTFLAMHGDMVSLQEK